MCYEFDVQSITSEEIGTAVEEQYAPVQVTDFLVIKEKFEAKVFLLMAILLAIVNIITPILNIKFVKYLLT